MSLNWTSLKAFRENPWFKLGARVCMYLAPILASGALWLLYDIRSNTVEAVATIKADVAQVVETQGERADVSDDNFADLKEATAANTAGLSSLNLKFERIAGSLETLAGRPLVGLNWRPSSAPDPPAN